MSNYYDNISDHHSFVYVEQATLVESIKIPINLDKLTLNYFNPKLKEESKPTGSGEDSYIDSYYEFDFEKVFSFPWDSLKNVQGKFKIPVLMPTTTSESEPLDKDARAPRKSGFKGTATMVTSSYQTSNYVSLTIPKYMLYQFIGSTKMTIDNKTKTAYCTIPAGTIFLISSYGGHQDLSKMRIIGLYTLD